MRPGG
jgi:hypothetical protein